MMAAWLYTLNTRLYFETFSSHLQNKEELKKKTTTVCFFEPFCWMTAFLSQLTSARSQSDLYLKAPWMDCQEQNSPLSSHSLTGATRTEGLQVKDKHLHKTWSIKGKGWMCVGVRSSSVRILSLRTLLEMSVKRYLMCQFARI